MTWSRKAKPFRRWEWAVRFGRQTLVCKRCDLEKMTVVVLDGRIWFECASCENQVSLVDALEAL